MTVHIKRTIPGGEGEGRERIEWRAKYTLYGAIVMPECTNRASIFFQALPKEHFSGFPLSTRGNDNQYHLPPLPPNNTSPHHFWMGGLERYTKNERTQGGGGGIPESQQHGQTHGVGQRDDEEDSGQPPVAAASLILPPEQDSRQTHAERQD